jgi:hypothetical protein
VNLELARLAVREHAVSEAVQYFHDAVYSEWEGDPVLQRRAVRLELVKFLLASDQQAAARAELIGVAANLPPDPELRTQVGVLLMNAGGYDDASISSQIDHLGWLRLAIRNVVLGGQKQFR